VKPEKLKETLQSKAAELGFDVCRITEAGLPDKTANHLMQFIALKRHASMNWMDTTQERRRSPTAMWPDAKSAILLGMNYGPDSNPMGNLGEADKATISVYARNRDYHDIIKGRLKTLAGWLAAQTREDVKVFVDTAPLMEKPLAEQAGLGWQGKHTNLVSREFGSWLFLGAILSATDLLSDSPETDHCGSCRACLDICPTDAFPAPYQLDAGKCISYLTIEHAGPIPIEFRKAMGNRIYGCDDCLAVCPWNKYAQATKELKLAAREELQAPHLGMLASLDDAGFRKFFSGSPIKRIGRNRFVRNVLIAIGNSGEADFLPIVREHLGSSDPIVRGAAVWAFTQLEQAESVANMKVEAIHKEEDESVRFEWDQFNV